MSRLLQIVLGNIALVHIRLNLIQIQLSQRLMSKTV
ncbi:unnamed protein product, partial [Brassica rapa subsp. trilocularis]